MKYLKEYNDEVSKIEELSDYLQELFDKHHIVEVEEKYDGSMSPRSRYDDPYWYIHPILDGYNRVDSQIVIRNITQIPTLKEDILKIIPNIETRLGQKINLWIDREYAVFGIKKNKYIKEWTDSFMPDDDIKPNVEDRLKWIDKEIKRLMALANVMDESEERDLLHLKMSELMDERDELRSEDGSLPPVEEEKPKKLLFVENPKTGIKEIVPNPAFSETLPPVKPNKYYHNSYYRKKTRDELASDTPIFEQTEIDTFHQIPSGEYSFTSIGMDSENVELIKSKIPSNIKVDYDKGSRGAHITGYEKRKEGLRGRNIFGVKIHDTMDINVYECKDEWFYTCVEYKSICGGKVVAYKINYYKCDQIEGVLQFLKWIQTEFYK